MSLRTRQNRHSIPRAPVVMALAALALSVSLGGCAGLSDSFASAAFVDPAKYDLYDCKSLEVERKSLATKTAELQGLIDKAQTGSGGAVVSELAYRNDHIATRAQAKLAEENWQRNKCVASLPAASPLAGAPSPTNVPRGAAKRSGGAIY